MSRRTLTHAQWARIEPLVPGKPGDPGRSGKDKCRFVYAILWPARTASPGRDLPPELGNWKTAHCRFRRWSLAGTWERLFKALRADPDVEFVPVDATVSKVHADATSRKAGLRRTRSAGREAGRPPGSTPRSTRPDCRCASGSRRDTGAIVRGRGACRKGSTATGTSSPTPRLRRRSPAGLHRRRSRHDSPDQAEPQSQRLDPLQGAPSRRVLLRQTQALPKDRPQMRKDRLILRSFPRPRLCYGVARMNEDDGQRARIFAKALRWLGIRHVRTRRCTPGTNVRAERFIHTLVREAACTIPCPTSDRRTADLQRGLCRYNRRRSHSALKTQSPNAAPNDAPRTHS